MSDYLPLLQRCVLFDGLLPQEMERLLHCCGASVRHYGRGEFLWQAGEVSLCVGIVLEGIVDAIEYTPQGEEIPTARQTPGGVFGDLLAAAGQPSPVSLRTPEGAVVLMLPLDAILGGCAKQCACHLTLRRNLLRQAATKFWVLREQVALLRQPRLRDKILLFLRSQPCTEGYITLPYTRQEMARLLNADRTALSRELTRMKDDGLLDYHRSTFRLLS